MKTKKKKLIQFPVTRIIIGGLICILIPILINKIILDNLFQVLKFDENINRGIRVFICAIVLMPLFYYLLYRKIEKREIMELMPKKKGKYIFLSFILSSVIISISFFSLLISGFIEIEFSQPPKLLLLNIILILGLVITEEILFRGIFYRIIETRWGTNIALLVSAILFAIMHLTNENTSIVSFLSATVGGILLGILYTYTKNLIVPISFHFGWNFSQVLYGFGLSGGNEFSKSYILKLHVKEPYFITGGASGVENSILVVIALLILFIILYRETIRSSALVQKRT